MGPRTLSLLAQRSEEARSGVGGVRRTAASSVGPLELLLETSGFTGRSSSWAASSGTHVVSDLKLGSRLQPGPVFRAPLKKKEKWAGQLVGS